MPSSAKLRDQCLVEKGHDSEDCGERAKRSQRNLRSIVTAQERPREFGPGTIAKDQNTEVSIMGLGVGIFLLAVGAVLAFAVKVNPTGGALDLNTVGWILIGAGALGIVLSMVFWSSWGGPGRFTSRTTDVGPTGDTRTSTTDQK